MTHPFWVKCSNCGKCWKAASAPMEGRAFFRSVKSTASRCAACGCKRILIARQNNGALLEDGEAARDAARKEVDGG
jgi:DNA-directed RNA polymerase subunit RPC12/RpoP